MNRAYMSMYKIYNDRHDYAGCVETMLDGERTMSPSWHPQINRRAGDAYFNMEEYGKAAERFSMVAESDAATADDWYKLANCCIAIGDPDGADRAAEGYLKKMNSAYDHSYWFIKARAEVLRLSGNNRADYSNFYRYYENARACGGTGMNYQNEAQILERDHDEVVRKGY